MAYHFMNFEVVIYLNHRERCREGESFSHASSSDHGASFRLCVCLP